MEDVVVSVDRELNWIKSKNLFLTIVILNFMWMLFHFTVVFFFTLQLESVALVWIFLWVWNLFAFLLDIPIWIIQNYYKAKTLYIISFISQILAMLIFANFIFQFSSYLTDPLINNTWNILWGFFSLFFWNFLNIILLLIASLCYWITMELQWVTTISYILNNANPSQYASIFAKNNVAGWIWSLFWLLLSWLILTFAPTLIIFIIILIIIIIITFTTKFFDNWEKSFNLKDISKFKVILDKENFENFWTNIKEKIVKSVNKIELKDIISKSTYIFLKPNTIKSWLTLDFLVKETKKTFILTYKVLTRKDWKLLIYWSIIMLLTFWFWDTFASTFLIDFLDWLLPKWSYLLLWVIALPAFWLQDFFGKMSKKFWNYKVANIWLILSWFSLILMWIYANSGNLLLLMWLALINSIWYASCMSLSQAVFLEEYNKSYANYNNLKEIDANAAAAPMKILQNFANVFWLFLGWIILSLLSYLWFFIIFWVFIVWFLYWSITKWKEIKK